MTTEQWNGLSHAEKDGAVAKALGKWRTVRLSPLQPGGREVYWQYVATGSLHGEPPPYVTGGDEDSYAHWDLFAEMWKKLPRENGQVWSFEDGGDYFAVFRHADPSFRVEGGTPHRAAAAAMNVAGLLRMEDAR